MKKIVLLLTAVLFAGMNANAANALTDAKEAANEGNIVVNIDSAAKDEVVVIDINTLSAEEVAKLQDGDLIYKKVQVIQVIKNIDEKIKEAENQKDETAVAKLNEEKNKMLEELDDVNAKLAESEAKTSGKK